MGLFSAIFGGANDKKVAKNQQAAIDAYNAIQKAEFAKRQGFIRESDSRVGALKDQGFAGSLALRDADFSSALANRDKGVTDLLGIERGAGAKMAARNDKFNLDTKGINSAQQGAYADSFSRLGKYNVAEQGAQAGFYGAGTGAVGTAFGKLGAPAFNARRGEALGDRAGFIGYAVSDPTRPTVATDAKFGSLLDQKVAEGVDFGKAQAVGAANIAAYGDATQAGTDILTRLGSDLQSVKTRAEVSREAYESESAAAKMVAENADASAAERRDAAKAELDSFLQLLRDEKDRDVTLSKDINTAEGEASSRFYADLANSLMQMYEGLTQTEADYLAKLIGASENRVSIAQQLTNFKVGNTRGSQSLLGSVLGAAENIGTQILIGKYT